MILGENLLYPFLGLSFINGAIAVYNTKTALNVVNKWNPKIISLNKRLDGVSDDDIVKFEDDIESTPVIASIVKKIKQITRKSSDLSVNEIHDVIDVDIMKWDSRLNNSANIFIMLGVFCTVLSLFLALPKEGLTSSSAEKLLSQFETAFLTTIIGLILAGIMKVLQYLIGGKIDDFRYNFVLLTKTILLPRYSIPDVDEKNLSQLVISISASSEAIKDAAGSLNDLAEQTSVGTENIERAITGFSTITEKMAQREDSLHESLGNLNKYLIGIDKNLNQTIKPLSENILESLAANAAKNELNLNQISDLRDGQEKINEDIKSTLSVMSGSVEKMSEFFGKDFQDIFKSSIEELYTSYNEKLKEVSSNNHELTQAIVKLIDDTTVEENTDHIIKNMEDHFKKVNGIINPMQDALILMQDQLNNVKKSSTDHNEIIEKMHGSMETVYDDTKAIHNAVYEIQNVTNEMNFQTFQDDLKATTENMKKMSASINSMRAEVDNIAKHISSLRSSDTGSLFKGFKKVFGDGK